MADTGFKFPGTAVANRTISGSDFDWTNQDNIKLDDGSNADAISVAGDEQSSGLAASNFDFSVIPTGAHIDGIEIRIEHNQASGIITWAALRLILSDNSDGSDDRNGELSVPSGNPTDDVGGATDLWSETISSTDVKNSNFGFFVGCDIILAGTLEVDFMQMRIFYHEDLPTTIVSDVGLAGHHPPFKSSGGAFYSVVRADADELDAYKATDPTTNSWSAQGTGPVHAETISVFACVQVSDVIHIAATGINGTNEYYTFNMATDAWVIDEAIDNPTDNPTFPWISIAVRSNGDVVVVYAGDTDKVMGSTKERVDINIRNGSWGGAVALEADDTLDFHYGNPNVIKGPLTDDMHVIWQMTTNIVNDPPSAWTDSEARTLRPSDDSLSTVDATGGVDTSSKLLGYANLVSYDDGGTQRIISAGPDTSSDLVGIQATEDGSDDIQQDSSFSKGLTDEIFINGEVAVTSLAELNGDLHFLFSGGSANGADKDLYYMTSIDDGATWTTEAEEIDAITVNFISANIYVRGINTVLAYVYDDGGVQKYNEKVLISINPALFMKARIGVRYY